MPQIVNIRGTSGSGKSTAVRTIMNMAIAEATKAGTLGIQRMMADPAFYPKKRRHPLFYLFPLSGQQVSVLGHYETDCGGCDTIPSYDIMMALIKERYNEGYHVIFEGLLVAHDKKQVTALWDWLKHKDFTVLELTEPLAGCLDSVRARRARKGADPNTFNPANTERRFKEVVRSCQQLEERGIPVRRVSRAEVVPAVLDLLGVRAEAKAA